MKHADFFFNLKSHNKVSAMNHVKMKSVYNSLKRKFSQPQLKKYNGIITEGVDGKL